MGLLMGLDTSRNPFQTSPAYAALADYEPDPGDSVAALARARGVSPAEIAYDIMLERDGQGMLWAGFANIIDGSLEPALAMMRSRLQGRPQPHRLRHA